MSLISKVQVTLNNISKKKAATIMKALEPDNVNFPKGLSLEIDTVSYTHLTLPTIYSV